MKKLLVPLILTLVGSGSGVAAGLFLFPPAPPTDPAMGPCGAVDPHMDATHVPTEEEIMTAAAEGGESVNAGYEYLRLPNQFIVPVVRDGAVSAMVALSISLEVMAGQKDATLLVEPKIRDVILRVLFDHANAGGFDGSFTASSAMRDLRAALVQAATLAAPELVHDVLITDIQRQDN
jgi:flagellar protein FliL